MSSTIHLLYYSLFISGSTCVCRVTVVWCFQDSQISYQQITKKKKKMRDTQHLFIPFFLFHPFVIWFLYSLLGLEALWSVWGCCLGCAPCSFSESIELLQLLSNVFIHCCFPLSIISHLYVLVSGLIIEVVKLIIRLHWLICGCRMALLWLIFLLWTRVLIWIKKIRLKKYETQITKFH